MNLNPLKSKKALLAYIITGSLIITGIVAWFVLADVNKKAQAAAEKYEQEVISYVERLKKARSASVLEEEIKQPPKLDDVALGEFSTKYKVAQSKEIIQDVYQARFSAAVKHYDDYNFDDEFRNLDYILQKMLTQESSAELNAEDRTYRTLNKLHDELLDLRYEKNLPETSEEYIAKQAEITKAELAAGSDPVTAAHNVRIKVLTKYKQKLEKISANDLTAQYKQSLLRSTDKKIGISNELIAKVKDAETPGEIRRLVHKYDRTQYEEAQLEHYDARWASEEVFYVNPNGHLTYTANAMKYIASTDTVPTDEQEAKLYADVIYYGHQAAEIVSPSEKKLSRTHQAKLRFGLNELRHSIAKSEVDQKLKDKYSQLVDTAYETVRVMPGDDSYRESSASARLDNVTSFINFLTNYMGVSYGKSVVDSDANEAQMRAELNGIRTYYSDMKAAVLPKTAHGKAERDAFIKQLDVCMEIRFGYYDQWIADTVALAKLNSSYTEYSAESDRRSANRDKLAAKYQPCYKTAEKLYKKANQRAKSYSDYRTLAIKQLQAIR